MKTIHLSYKDGGYDITVGAGLLSDIGSLINLDRRVVVVTDDGVPPQYAQAVADRARDAKVVTVKNGEGAKSAEVYAELCRELLDFGISRKDAVVAVGGGVVGDLSGFVAATFMRGIDFYNVPTTLLSQVDSSIGGKTAINLGGVKNIVGAIYRPRAVIIDTDVLKTLDKRQISNGLAECVKMALTSDAELFNFLSENDPLSDIESVIIRSLLIKKQVVLEDECESHLRKILNFGHTLGHGIEAEGEMAGLLHGECVALGMIPMCSHTVRERLIPLLERLGLPTDYSYDLERALAFTAHDKKCSGGFVDAVFVDEVGSFRIEKMPLDAWQAHIKANL